MKCCIMWHFIWIFTVCKSTLIWGFPVYKRLKKMATCLSYQHNTKSSRLTFLLICHSLSAILAKLRNLQEIKTVYLPQQNSALIMPMVQ